MNLANYLNPTEIFRFLINPITKEDIVILSELIDEIRKYVKGLDRWNKMNDE